jgi:leucine dehydrogenase
VINFWNSPEFDAHEQVCLFTDPASGLRAIVAVHSTALGGAVGGTRFLAYPDEDLALNDALRLSRAMSYKCALAGMPCGGGKAVLIGDPVRIKSSRLLHAFGAFLNRIGSTFVTGEDVGMSVKDVETIREVSPYVAGTSQHGAGDPSVHTAIGVMHGLRAVLRHRFGRRDFKGTRIAIQGLGATGWNLAKRLTAEQAQLVVADVRDELAQRAQVELGATVLSPTEILRAEVDILSPCALGGVVTEQTALEVRAGAVAGSANNQLASPAAGQALAARGILYAPDYVINAGGVMSGLEEYLTIPGRSGAANAPLDARLSGIESRLDDIFGRAARQNRTPEATAEAMARELIGR